MQVIHFAVIIASGNLSQLMKQNPAKFGLKPERLLAALDASNKTRAQLAAELGVDKATAGRWIAGKREPETLEMLGKLCKALDKNLAYLTADDESAQNPKEVLFLRLSRTADPTLVEAALAVLAAGQPIPKIESER